MTVLKIWESPEGRSFEPFSFDTFVRRMNERVAGGRYEEGDLKGLLRRQDGVDLKRMVADVSETYAFLRNLTDEERTLSSDQYKKDVGRYETSRAGVRALDPTPRDPTPSGVEMAKV
jgi:hypothetical protein